MFIIIRKTFIKIDSLEHLEISRQTCPTNRSKIRATTFTFGGHVSLGHQAIFYSLMCLESFFRTLLFQKGRLSIIMNPFALAILPKNAF